MLEYKELSDRDLVAAIQAADEKAYAEIFERYWTVLFLHAMHMLRDEEEARDIVQELFTVLWQKASDLQITSTLSAYLYKSVRNRVFDHIKRKKVMTDYLQSLSDFMDEGLLETDTLIREKQLHEAIEAEIAALPSKMRVIFELSRKQHLSYKEIAQQLNITEHTVKSQVSNALRILRSKFGATAVLFYFLLEQ